MLMSRVRMVWATPMIVLCNPSNPTGAVIPESLLRQILELAAARGLFVLADEIYHDISYDDEPPASTLEIAQELDMLSHVLLIGGASKSFAMTGTAHSSKERRRPLLLQPFWTVTEPPPGLLVPLSGILASRRRKQRKNGEKTSKNGRDMA